MTQAGVTFVIPTYRLRDVGQTVEEYDQHVWKNGHSVPIVVFDDSSPANQEKYFPLLEKTSTHNDLYYVGPREKEQFLGYLDARLRDARLEGLVRDLFRPSYGGNRNFTLMYTLGGLMVSSDDDMRPYALMEDSPESLRTHEVARGRLHRAGQEHFVHKSFDILAAFEDVLGMPVAEIPENYERGEWLVDTAMDLETNATKGLAFRPGPGAYLVYLGRMSPEKRVDRAIEIARRAGMPLKIAAKIYPEERGYFDEELAPLLESSRPLVEFVGEIGNQERDDLLGGAAALVFPIEWPEPFGLVMIEAMACGTPVVAWRRGSVTEVVDDGVTGYVVETIDEAVSAVGRIGGLSRVACRRVFEERFGASRMAGDYLEVYHGLLTGC